MQGYNEIRIDVSDMTLGVHIYSEGSSPASYLRTLEMSLETPGLYTIGKMRLEVNGQIYNHLCTFSPFDRNTRRFEIEDGELDITYKARVEVEKRKVIIMIDPDELHNLSKTARDSLVLICELIPLK